MHHNVSKQQFHPVNNNPDEHTMRPSEIIEAPTRTTAPPLGAKFKIKKTGQNRVICIINRDRTPHNEIETAFRYAVRANTTKWRAFTKQLPIVIALAA